MILSTRSTFCTSARGIFANNSGHLRQELRVKLTILIECGLYTTIDHIEYIFWLEWGYDATVRLYFTLMATIARDICRLFTTEPWQPSWILSTLKLNQQPTLCFHRPISWWTYLSVSRGRSRPSIKYSGILNRCRGKKLLIIIQGDWSSC